jgi:hypothetical protein
VLRPDIPAIVALNHGLAVFDAAAFQHGNIHLPERLEQWLQKVLAATDTRRMKPSAMILTSWLSARATGPRSLRAGPPAASPAGDDRLTRRRVNREDQTGL